VVEGLNVYPVESLPQARELLNAAVNGGIQVQPYRVRSSEMLEEPHIIPSISKMCGDNRRQGALEISLRAVITFDDRAAGSGKTMLAKRLPRSWRL